MVQLHDIWGERETDQLLVREAQRSSRAAATAPAFPNIHAQIRNAIFQKARPGLVRK